MREMGWADWARQATDPQQAGSKPEALDDLLVLDCSHGSLAGCFASSILAEFGAEVLRIEPPEGDPARQFTPEGFLHEGTGLGYLPEGRNKLHVTLNLASAEGRELFRSLARRADVLIETFLPGLMDGWGIGYRQLSEEHPGLIYCALATYGQFGPKATTTKPPADVVDQALSGIAYFTGEPESEAGAAPYAVPTRQGTWYGWYSGGAFAAFGILLALHHRVMTGKGQLVDVSPAEAAMRFAHFNLLWYHAEREILERMGNLDSAVFPYTYFRCKGGFVFVAGFLDPNWAALTAVIGRPDLRERYPAMRDRLEHARAIFLEIEAWTLNYTADEILERVQRHRGAGVVATGPVNEPWQTVGEVHWWERGVFQRFRDPYYGDLLIQAPPWKMDRTPPRLKWVCRPVGADTEAVFAKYLGLGPTKLAALRGAGVV
jgi:crotonobetainyl-CoA:carnitine CoA-transferase CaiB-like acyl-CoA transferase